MKRGSTALCAAIFVGLIASPAMAQVAEPRPNPDITRGEVANFDQYLDSHPKVARELVRDPRLVNNPQFLANHPGLQSFLAGHPGVREEIHESPGQFMYREGKFEWHERGEGYGITRGEVARFDNGYLDKHPEVAEALAKDPRLVDNQQFVASHPGLHEYLEDHPGIRTELKAHPDRFMGRERYYEHHVEPRHS
jgi:hypothetical protein